MSNITGEDLSLEAEYALQICKTCYRRLNTIVKQDDMQKKRQLLSQAIEEVGTFLIAYCKQHAQFLTLLTQYHALHALDLY